MSSKLFRLLALFTVLAMTLSPLNARPSLAVIGPATDEPTTENTTEIPVTTKGVTGGTSDTGLYIVQLTAPSLAAYKGDVPSLAATSPEVTGARKLDVNSPESQAYLSFLEVQQSDFIAQMETALGRSVEVVFQYRNVLNALAVRVSFEEAASLSQLGGVREVFADTLSQLDTDVGPTWIGADEIWAGDTGTGVYTEGEGIIIGVIDTGINHLHPSFADLGGDGYDHDNPLPGYVGWCTTNPSFCNDKLIGAYGLNPVGGNPEDTNGHGSHTSSTAGGNRHEAVFIEGTTTFTRTISGVAPHANIIAYQVCNNGCPGSASVAAVDLAIGDSVDVLNYSISGADDPWNDAVDLAFLDAYAAGIYVSASAGNDGPDPSTVAKTGAWNAAVGAATHTRMFANPFDITGPGVVPGTLIGLAALQGTGPTLTVDISASIAYDPANLYGCNAFSGDFTGKLALIQRGPIADPCSFADKVTNAYNAGAVGVVVFNHSGGPPIIMGGLEATLIPSAMLSLSNGLAVQDWIDDNPTTATATLYAEVSAVENPDLADIMADFSSRGPSQFDILKPDFIAPGVNILAAVAASGGEPVQYGLYGGTSMAAPHGAGAAALMVDLHPDWSPAEIKSAMASSAYNGATVLKEDGTTPADPHDMGSGRIALGEAATAGLVWDETYDNFVAANPDLGGDPKSLNISTVTNQFCVSNCFWTRTVKSVLDADATYTATFTSTMGIVGAVTPVTFTIPAGGTQILTITADVSSLTIGTWAFGYVMLETDAAWLGGEGAADQHMTMSVVPAASNVPELVIIKTDQKSDSRLVPDLQVAEEITDLTTVVDGLNQAALYKPEVVEDPTNTNPYNGDGTFVATIDVPAGALRLVAQVMESTSLDVDMFVGTGTTPSAATLVCSSATSAVLEYCNIDDPAAGTYWVLVQNWEGSGAPTDLIATAVGTVMPGDVGNMTVTGPATVLPGVPFGLSVNWDIPDLVDEDVYYAVFTVGTDPANPDNLGRVAVNFSYSQPIFLSKLGPASAQTGAVVQYDLVMEGAGMISGSAWLTDTLPVGVEYAGGLTASSGTASYDDATNSVYWSNRMPLVAYLKGGSARQTDGLPPTVKEADLAPAVGPEKRATQPSSSILGTVTLLEEGFEAGVMPPAGWSVIDSAASRHWDLVDTGTNPPAWIHSGTYAGWVNYVAEDQDEWLISPLLELTYIQNPMAEFWVYANNNWVSYAELQFLVIDDGGTFTDTLWYQSDETWPYPSIYHYLPIDLSAYEGGSVYLAWRYVGNDGDSIALDDILVTGDEAVPQVITVTFDVTVTAESGYITNMADLTYDGDAFAAEHVLAVAALPEAEFTSNTPAMLGEAAVFTPTVTGTGPFEYLWEFGDSITGTLENPSHVYTNTGVYSVTLTATNQFGTDSVTQLFEVVGLPLAVTFASNSPVTLGEMAVFTPTVTGTGPYEYLWDFGDEVTSTLESPTHLYEMVDTFTVTLTVTSEWDVETYTAQFVVNPVVVHDYFMYMPLIAKTP
jgi:PKD repeat protein/subtilisin family serine protease